MITKGEVGWPTIPTIQGQADPGLGTASKGAFFALRRGTHRHHIHLLAAKQGLAPGPLDVDVVEPILKSGGSNLVINGDLMVI